MPTMNEKTPLSEFLPYQLSITSNAVSGRIALEYRQRFGLSVPEWRVMAVLGDAGALTQRDLTRLTLMDKVAVNRACKVLEERGLAQRRPNAHDGRSHLLDLTESGVRMRDEIMPLALEMERRLFASFAPEEVAQFRGLLERVRGEVEDLDADDIDSGNFGVQ
jgi:DNA-binding MarR family transcriptional regulator